MHRYAFLGLLPAALGCLDPGSNPCPSYISANKASASAFCKTFTQSTVTATTALPAWASNCSNKPSLISKECSCAFTGAAATTTAQATTTKATTTAKATTLVTTTVAAPTGLTTALPNSSGAVATSKAITVSAGQTYDGGMKNYDRSRMSERPSVLCGKANTEQPRFVRNRPRLVRPMPCSCWRTAPLWPTYVPSLLQHVVEISDTESAGHHRPQPG